MRILLLLVVMTVSGCAAQTESFKNMVKNALPDGEVGDALRYGKKGSVKFNPFGDKGEDEIYSPRNVSADKLAFEDSNGLCDAKKLPQGTVPLRFDSIPAKHNEITNVYEQNFIDILRCEVRYLHAAKSNGIPQLDKNELSYCAQKEYLFKMIVEGSHTNVKLPQNSFETEKIIDRFTPMIQARVNRLKNANQYCISPRASSIAIQHYDLQRQATPIAFSGLAEYFMKRPSSKASQDYVKATSPLPLTETRATGIFQLTEPKDTGKTNAAGNIFTETELLLDQSEESFTPVEGGFYRMFFKTNKNEAQSMEEGTKPLSALAYLKVVKTTKNIVTQDHRSLRRSGGVMYDGQSNVTQHKLVMRVSHFEMDYKDKSDTLKKFVNN